MIKTKKIDRGTITYNNDSATRDAVFEKVLAWFIEVESFSGECVMQSDVCQIEAPDLLAKLADDFFEFDVEYDEDENGI